LQFSYLDTIILFLYLGLVTWIGLYFSKNETGKDFFLADKKLPWYFLMLSIIATETSSLTFLHIPGISYKGDFSFLQLAFGFILGRTFVAYILLPAYYQKGYISIYQWIGENYGTHAAKNASIIFLFTRVLGDGVRLYATSIPIAFLLKGFLGNHFSDIEVSVFSLAIISFFTTLYTVYGGFQSVVATDVIQFIVYIAGGLFALFFLYHLLPESMTLQTLFDSSIKNNKLIVYKGFQGNFFHSPYFFINGIIAGFLLTIGSHGVDQMFVQRVLACSSEKEGRYALIGSGILVFFQFTIFLLIGLLLYFYYNLDHNIPQTEVFSKFIVEKIPSPLGGLMVAAVLASAMSTLSSSINSMSLTLIADWKTEKHSQVEKDILTRSRIYSLFWGFILFLSSLIPLFFSSRISDGLVELGLKIASFTYGPLIGLFLLLRLQKNLAKRIKPVPLNISLALSIFIIIAISNYYELSVGNILIIGIGVFYLLLFLLDFSNIFINKKIKKTK
jgi:Na+/proline symporter